MKINLKNTALHLTGWIIFLSIPHYIFRFLMPMHHMHHDGNMPPPHTFGRIDASIFIFNTLLIAFYYANSYIFIPYILGRRKRFWYSALIILLMILVVSSPAVVSMLFPMPHPPGGMENHREMLTIRVLVTTLLFAIIFIVSTGIRIIKAWYSAEQ